MKELIKSAWNYILYEKDGKLILSALCGTVALFDINIVLNEEEQSAFEKHGQEYIDGLVENIRYSPASFKDRHIGI